MKLQTLLYISLIFLAFQSCGVRKFDPSMQNALFSADYQPNAEGKVCTQGYYLPYDADCASFRRGRGFKLSDNGLVTYVNFIKFMIPADSLSNGKMDEYIKSYKYFFEGYYDKGSIYKISGDTLIIDIYKHEYINIKDYWELRTTKYKIIDRETLVEIPTSNDSKEKLRYELCGHRVYRFVPATIFQNEFDTHARNKKWMWKNEEDWKAYKKARDEYKKSLWQQTPCHG